MAKPSATNQMNILIPIYTGFNTLDVNGPLDVLCNYGLRAQNDEGKGPGPFKITIAGPAKEVHAYEYATMHPDITCFDEAIELIKEGKVDILLVPGCGPGYAEDILNIDGKGNPKSTPLPKKFHEERKILDVIATFLAYDNTHNKDASKWLVSVCVGAKFLGYAGVFHNRDATTHWGALPQLITICETQNVPAKSITRARWIDGGSAEPVEGMQKPTRIVSSGGISCGIDCCLWLVQQIMGTASAVTVAEVMDYRWLTQGTVTPSPYCG